MEHSNNKQSIFNGKLVSLRPIEPEDLDYIYLWENDTSIWKVSNTLTPFSYYIIKKYIENSHQDIFEAKQLRLIIEQNETKTPVGCIDLFDFDPQHKRAGVGVLIAEDKNRNKGYASESLQLLINYAFLTLKLHQLYANISENNTSSIKLFTKLKFEKTGERKDWLLSQNGWITEYFFKLINI